MVQPRTPRVLLVELDGGVARAALAADHRLAVRTIDSFDRARIELRRVASHVVVIALDKPTAFHVVELKSLSACRVPILIVSSRVEEERVTELIKAGAGGYLFAKDATSLPAAIRELLRGGVPMSQTVSRLVLARARRSSAKMLAVQPASAAAESLLTARQREILTLLASGHSYDDIGLALGLSVNTVRTHVRSIYERLGASTKVEAVVAAIELRLLDRKPLG